MKNDPGKPPAAAPPQAAAQASEQVEVGETMHIKGARHLQQLARTQNGSDFKLTHRIPLGRGVITPLYR